MESCIAAPAGSRVMVLKAQYLTICKDLKDAQCAAALLSMFEHWTNFKAENWRAAVDERAATGKKYRVPVNLWIFMSQEQMKDELFGLFGENRIRAALDELIAAGFIRRRNNPRKRFDRKYQYLLMVKHVQTAIDCHSSISRNAFRWIEVSKALKERIDAAKARQRSRQKAEAIPQESVAQESAAQNAFSQKSFHMMLWLTVLANSRKQAGLKPAPTATTTEETKPQNAFNLWTNEIGTLTPLIANELKDLTADYSDEWVQDAIKEARRTVGSGKIGTKYIAAILKRWKQDGRTTTNPSPSSANPLPETAAVEISDEEWEAERQATLAELRAQVASRQPVGVMG